MESNSLNAPDGDARSSSKRRARKTVTKALSKDLRTYEKRGSSENLQVDDLIDLGDSASPFTFAGAVAAGRFSARRKAARSGSSLLRLGSASVNLDDENGGSTPTGSFSPSLSPSVSQDPPTLTKSPTGSTSNPAFRRGARRSQTMLMPGLLGDEEAEASTRSGGNRLMMLTSAVTTLQSMVKDKTEDVVVGDPNEVILDSDDDSDDEENEEIERDFVSALQRVQDSGRLSLHELRVFEKELKQSAPKLFDNESDIAILAGLQNAKYIEAKADEILWSRYSELYSGILLVERPICIVIKGRVSIAKPGIPEGVKVLKGSVINADDPDVLGIVAVEPCKLLYIESSQVEEDMERSKSSWRKVDYNLRKKRPTSTWPEDLLDDLMLCLHHLPFFEDFDLRTLRSILRNLRFHCLPIGESVPPRPEVSAGSSTTSTNPTIPSKSRPERPECHLVMLWEGKAGKYKRVQSADEQMICTQIEMMALEGLGRKPKPSGPSPREDMPELDETYENLEVEKKDGKVYLKRYGNLRLGAVLGERDLIDPGGPETGQPIVRCEGPCYVLSLARADYLHCLKEQQIERMRVIHALRNVPASRPGEPHHRSQEQLALLAKLVRNTPELKNFEQDALMQVLGAATFINAAPGHILCHQGEVGDRFFAIIEGMVSIHVRPKIEIESALATAAESKGTGNQLIKTMLAALSQHRVEEAKKQKLAAPAPTVPQRSPSELSEVSDVSRRNSFVSDAEDASIPNSPTSSFRLGATSRRKIGKVSFTAEEMPRTQTPQIVIEAPAPLKGEESLELSPSRQSQVADEESNKETQSPESPESPESPTSSPSSGSKTLRRKSLKDRLRGGLFWSGIKKRLSSAAPVAKDLGKMVNRMGPGAAFGAKTLLKKDARTASVQTVEPTKLLVVTREDYVGLMSSIEEARAREAAEFLCRHVLMVEVRSSSNRALDNLHPALRQRMARTSKAMTSHTLDRGMVLLTHDTDTSDTVHILRKGSWAFCYPNEQQGCPSRWHRSKVASMNASQVVSTPGELVGAHKALLHCKEPATVRVESASCEVYRVPWTELQRVLTSRVLSLMKDKLRRCHDLRSGVAATRSPKDMLSLAVSSSIVGAVPSREQQAVKDALENAFSTACSFATAADGGGIGASYIEAMKSSPKRPLSHRQVRPVRPARALAEREAKEAKAREAKDFVENLAKAVAKLKETTQRADLWESLRTGEADAVNAAPSLPPPITSDAHVRARFFKVLKDDPGLLGMEKFLSDCVLDPDKANLNAWIKKYTSSEKLRKHSELQSLQMILRKQVKNPRAQSNVTSTIGKPRD